MTHDETTQQHAVAQRQQPRRPFAEALRAELERMRTEEPENYARLMANMEKYRASKRRRKG